MILHARLGLEAGAGVDRPRPHALDRLHRPAINQFRPAKTAGEVGRLWDDAVGRGSGADSAMLVRKRDVTPKELAATAAERAAAR